ncbi:MAG: hypothetical protein H0V12_10855, partial [Chloroflexi bacterium]|nr:hypothetical protein [Chloroflexota bacterium]
MSYSSVDSPRRQRLRPRLLLVALLALGLLYPAAGSAVGGTPSVSLRGPARVAVGQPITLVLSARNVRDVAGYEATLSFDRSAAHFGSLEQRSNDLRAGGRGILPFGGEETAAGVAFGAASCPVRDCVSRRGERVRGGRHGTVKLARIQITPDRPGRLQLRLGALKVVDASGRPVAVSVPRSVVTVVVGSGGTPHAAPRTAWSLGSESRVSRTADVTGDGLVTNADAMELVTGWTLARLDDRPCSTAIDARLDLNGDGCLDVADLQILAAAYSSAAARRAAPAGAAAGPQPKG